MTLVYLLLIFLPIFAELSPHVATDGIIKKLWLGMISIGGGAGLAGAGNDLIYCGIILHLAQMIYYNHKFHARRKST